MVDRLMTAQTLAHWLHQPGFNLLFRARPSNLRPLCFSMSSTLCSRKCSVSKRTSQISPCQACAGALGLAWREAAQRIDFLWNAGYERRWGHRSWCIVPSGCPACSPGGLRCSPAFLHSSRAGICLKILHPLYDMNNLVACAWISKDKQHLMA